MSCWPSHLPLAALLLSLIVAFAQAPAGTRDATLIVERIIRADYEGDRASLARLYLQAAAVKSASDDRHLQSRVGYWQGFALWRRALNGFNQSVDPKDLEQDLRRAIGQFEETVRQDPTFVDAKVGLISCLQSLAFLHQSEDARVREVVPRFVQLLKESLAVAPENPRLLWVYGASRWWAPPGLPTSQVIARQETAIATYKRGLEFARKEQRSIQNPLEPAWGEPELLMSLAWANLNRTTPDLGAAEGYGRQALTLVPHWQYVRDVLMPQISALKTGNERHHSRPCQKGCARR